MLNDNIQRKITNTKVLLLLLLLSYFSQNSPKNKFNGIIGCNMFKASNQTNFSSINRICLASIEITYILAFIYIKKYNVKKIF